jgi:hypothetical protein
MIRYIEQSRRVGIGAKRAVPTTSSVQQPKCRDIAARKLRAALSSSLWPLPRAQTIFSSARSNGFVGPTKRFNQRSHSKPTPSVFFRITSTPYGRCRRATATSPRDGWWSNPAFRADSRRRTSRSASKIAKREKGIWQRRYWEHAIRSDADFERHVDYIHYNPVKHGLVSRAADWPYSSFHRYVEHCILPADWGSDAMEAAGQFGE